LFPRERNDLFERSLREFLFHRNRQVG
jgi:hypothetical protein